MSQQQTYLLHVLRRVESSAQNRMPRTMKLSLESIIERISRSADVQSALEMLYAVKGFDAFALRLMWCLERSGIATGDTINSLDADVEEISDVLIGSPTQPSRDDASVPSPAHEVYYDRLHSLGKIVEEVRRRSEQLDALRTVDTEILYRVSSELEALREASISIGKQEIAACVTGLVGFVQFAIENGIEHDPRLAHVLAHANLTLQTVEESVTSDGYASVAELTNMLKNPGTILTR